MIIYSAIGLRRGLRVPIDLENLHTSASVNETDPIHVAKRLVEQGAEWIHLLNLDGTMGVPNSLIDDFFRPQSVLIHHPGANNPETPLEHASRQLPDSFKILQRVKNSLDVSVQIMGGLRTFEDIRMAFKLDAQRVVLDMETAGRPDLIDLAVKKWGPDRILVAVCKDGEWYGQESLASLSDEETLEFGHYLHALGVRTVVFVPQRGPCSIQKKNVEMAARLGDNTGLKVILDSAISGLGDLRRIKSREHYNLDGVVVADTTCSFNIDLRAAVDLANLPLHQRSAGIVPYRMTEYGPEFLILFNLFFDQWQFPRGGVQAIADSRTDAVREFCKETGLPVLRLHDTVHTTLHYTAKIRNYSIDRTIDYYLAEVGSGPIRLGHENHCEARWVNGTEAWELLDDTSPEQLPALSMAIKHFSAGCRVTRGLPGHS